MSSTTATQTHFYPQIDFDSYLQILLTRNTKLGYYASIERDMVGGSLYIIKRGTKFAE